MYLRTVTVDNNVAQQTTNNNNRLHNKTYNLDKEKKMKGVVWSI